MRKRIIDDDDDDDDDDIVIIATKNDVDKLQTSITCINSTNAHNPPFSSLPA